MIPPSTVIVTEKLRIGNFGHGVSTGQGVETRARLVVPGATAINCQPKGGTGFMGLIGGSGPTGAAPIGAPMDGCGVSGPTVDWIDEPPGSEPGTPCGPPS